MDTVDEGAAKSTIRDLDGNEHELKETWARKPVVLAFVRHFG